MKHLTDIDLRTDPAAKHYVKHEIVDVVIASSAGVVMSLEGQNRYAPGDAVITGAGGERWVVSRDRFAMKYEPVAPTQSGMDGAYRAVPVPVLAKQMQVDFSIERSPGGDVLTGAPGDWLMQYAFGDYGITKHARFAQVYRLAQQG